MGLESQLGMLRIPHHANSNHMGFHVEPILYLLLRSRQKYLELNVFEGYRGAIRWAMQQSFLQHHLEESHSAILSFL